MTLECETDGATIYYTTDGTTPSASKTQYSDPFAISGKSDGESITVKAIAIKEGMANSTVKTITYTNNHVTA